MKYCIKCEQVKELSNFIKNNRPCKQCLSFAKKKYKDKYKERLKIKSKEYSKKNKEKITEYAKEWYLNNKEKKKAQRRLNYLNNKEKITKQISEYQSLNKQYLLEKQRERSRRERPKLNAKTAKRRAQKIQATPKWLTKEHFKYIEHLYLQAKELEKLDGIKRHVDHIIPLNGKNVTGLHVPWNLQILTAEENISKGNRLHSSF